MVQIDYIVILTVDRIWHMAPISWFLWSARFGHLGVQASKMGTLLSFGVRISDLPFVAGSEVSPRAAPNVEDGTLSIPRGFVILLCMQTHIIHTYIYIYT